MKEYEVSIWVTAARTVTVKAKDADDAVEKVEKRLAKRKYPPKDFEVTESDCECIDDE